MSRRRALALGWLAALALASLLPIAALFHGIVHLGPGELRLSAASDAPVIALGSSVRAPAGTRSVVVVIAGDVWAGGHIRDDVVVFDGRVYLNRRSHVIGDVLAVLGTIYLGPGVTVDGRLGGAMRHWDGKTAAAEHRVRQMIVNSIRLGLAAGLALLLAGACLTIVFPWQIVLISTTFGSFPAKSIGAGAMCALTFLFLVVPLGLSLAGLPFAVLLTAAAALAWLFGMTAIAVSLGRLVARRPAPLLWASAAGLVVLAGIMAVPVIGPLAVSLTGLAGAGALAVALIDRSRPFHPAP